MLIILNLDMSSPTIGLAITKAIKYTVNTNETRLPAFKLFFIVGNANEMIDVSIAAINIISMSAITVMMDLRFIKKLPFYWI